MHNIPQNVTLFSSLFTKDSEREREWNRITLSSYIIQFVPDLPYVFFFQPRIPS